jgi:DNA-binding MarR family transcriptional regulator
MTYDKYMTTSPVPTATTPRSTELAADLRVALMLAVRRIRAERGPAEMTDAQYSALAALSCSGPTTPTALAERERVQPPHITRVINALVTAGLVRRDEHPTDHRQVLVSLTDAGTVEVRETRRRRDEWLAGRLAAFDDAERETLARAVVLLRRVTDG